jgi:hypothetical protein
MPDEPTESVSLCVTSPTGLPPLDGLQLLVMCGPSRLLLIVVLLINSCIGYMSKHSDTVHWSTDTNV